MQAACSNNTWVTIKICFKAPANSQMRWHDKENALKDFNFYNFIESNI